MVARRNSGKPGQPAVNLVREAVEKTGLAGLFQDDGKEAARRSKRKPIRHKEEKPKGVRFSPAGPDDEPSDVLLLKWKTIQFRNLFTSNLPKGVQIMDINNPDINFIFAHLVQSIFNQAAHPRQVYRCLRSIAKDIKSFIKMAKLPPLCLSIAKMVSMRDGLIQEHLKKIM